MNLKILTWNIWWRFGDWQARQNAIRSVLQANAPDVCCLQEVWSDADGNFASLLAQDAGLHCAFFPSPNPQFYQKRIGTEEIGVGNAILSKWQFVQTGSEALTSGGAAQEGRSVSYAEIACPGGPLQVFTTHLNSGITDSHARMLQAAQLASFMRRHVSPGLPPILAGDFNCEPDADEIRMLTGRSKPPEPGFGVRDAWRLVSEDAGATWSRRNPYVARTPQLPDSRIDYVFIGYPDGREDLEVKSCKLVGTGPVEGIWPSDHFGLSVEASIIARG